MKKSIIAAAVFVACSAAPSFAADTEITLGRFFGACEDAPKVIADAVGEACIIQSIINGFDTEDNGVSVKTLPTDWGNYYDQVKASYAGGTPPNVHVMHKHRIPEFAGLRALAAITPEEFKQYGIDVNDWSDSALEAVSHNGQIYGIPMDLHANLWHLNMDLMQQAGLVNPDGSPMMPSSPQELLAHAKQMKDKTGKDYLAADFAQFPLGVRTVLALLWQQDSNIFEGRQVSIDTPEARKAITAITDLFEAGYANAKLNYTESQQAFLDGNAAALINGTWVVDFYDAQAANQDVPLDNYRVTNFPTLFDSPATWADSHIWVIPASLKQDPAKFDAAMKMLAWINEHNLDWSRTGHMAVRKSVLGSEAYQRLPHRAEYVATSDMAKDNPPAMKYGAIQDVLNREFQSIWLTGKSIEDALADAEYDVEDLL